MATAKLSSFVNKSAQSDSKEEKMVASTARYSVFTLQGESKKKEAWASHFLAVSLSAPLSDKEKAALLDVFDVAVAGKPRKSFERCFFRGMTAAMAQAGIAGGELYWLADESQAGLDQVKAMVEETIGKAKAGKPAAQQPQGDAQKGKAASKGKNGKSDQRKAAEAKAAKRGAMTVVLG